LQRVAVEFASVKEGLGERNLIRLLCGWGGCRNGAGRLGEVPNNAVNQQIAGLLLGDGKPSCVWGGFCNGLLSLSCLMI